MTVALEDRFWSKVDRTDDCWVWTASRTKKGYGKFGRGGRGQGWAAAHRVSFELANGPIDPAELCVLHRCDNPPCVNPAHLFLGTRLDNARDMVAKGRSRGQKATHCAKGHPFSPENTYIKKGPKKRACKTCVHNRYIERRMKDGLPCGSLR